MPRVARRICRGFGIMCCMNYEEEKNEVGGRREAASGVWFEGRESRRTYLVKTLVYLGSALLLILGGLLIGGRRDGGRVYLDTESPIGAVYGLLIVCHYLGVTLCFYIPSLARRLHDFGRSGWWVVLYCVVQNILRNIPFVREGSWLFELAGILFPVLMPGSKGENAYGPPPKGVDLSWVRRWPLVYVVPCVLLAAAFAWKCLCPATPHAEEQEGIACERVLSSEEMERQLDGLAVTNCGGHGIEGFEKFREYTRGNSLSLSNLTVEALFSLGGGMSELWCRHVRDGKTVFVLVYFESSLMDSLPRMFAHGDRINSVTGTVADSIDRYLRALKEHNRGLNACPCCGNAIWLVNPHFDVAFVCDVPPNVDVTRMTGDELAEIAHGLPKHARQEKMQRLLRPIQGSELKFSSCRVVGSDMDKDHCPHVDFVVLDPDTGEDAFSITVKLDDGKAAEWAKRIEKGAVVRNMRATLCEKEDFYFCRGAMTSLIWMRDLVLDSKWAEPMTLAGVPNLHKVSDKLYRSAQPTAEGMTNLVALGIKTVVNLRDNHSDSDEIGDLPLKARRIEIFTANMKDKYVDEFLSIVDDTNAVPVLVHCQHGADRTGTMCAMYRILREGWTADDAIDEMKNGGFGYHSVWGNLPRFIRKSAEKRAKANADGGQ